jgi:hypothetical protein
MASIILQSAENSSLISTIQNSDSKVNPSIYNTKEIYPNSSSTWINIDPQSMSAPSNASSVTFALPKYGILQQILLSFSKTATRTAAAVAATTTVIPAGDVFRCIDHIDFLSSSRVVSTLYAEDLMAQYSNLSSDQLKPIMYTSINQSVLGNVNGDKVTANYTIPIVFGFNNDINTAMNLSFNEPSQLRITWNTVTDVVTTTDANGEVAAVAGVTTSLTPPSLGLRYQVYGESDTAEMLASNFSSDQLNILTSKFYRENPFEFEGVATKTTQQIILRNIDVVKSFYVMCKRTNETVGIPYAVGPPVVYASAVSPSALVPIEKVEILASGQTICEMTYNQSQYSKLTHNGYATSATINGDASPINLENVFKIQTGLWSNDGGGPWSNAYSLREMNNVLVKCTFAAGSLLANANYTLFVVEDCSTIISINSSTGRVVNSLSN